MAVYKDNATGTWRVIYRFTDWKGERKQTQKRGFATKKEAQSCDPVPFQSPPSLAGIPLGQRMV